MGEDDAKSLGAEPFLKALGDAMDNSRLAAGDSSARVIFAQTVSQASGEGSEGRVASQS